VGWAGVCVSVWGWGWGWGWGGWACKWGPDAQDGQHSRLVNTNLYNNQYNNIKRILILLNSF